MHRDQDGVMLSQRLDATNPGEQTRLECAYQSPSIETLPFIPPGDYRRSAAWRDNLTDILKGPSVAFWNVKKS